jgi:hypothetical protein
MQLKIIIGIITLALVAGGSLMQLNLSNQTSGTNETVKTITQPENTTTTKEAMETEQTASTSLTPEEINNILFMREEEKLAKDVYLTLYEIWGLQIFQNIAESEQRHMDAV